LLIDAPLVRTVTPLYPVDLRAFHMNADSRHATIDVSPTTAISPQTWNEIWGLTQSFYDTERPYVEGKLREHQRAPELEFFARANPGHADGDMLVCLCPLSAANWLSVGVRALQRARRGGPSFEEAAHA
jgi:hypothetical protein